MLPDLLFALVRLAAPTGVVAASATEVLGIAAYTVIIALVLRAAIRWSESAMESDAAASRSTEESGIGSAASRPTHAGSAPSSPIHRTGSPIDRTGR